MKAEVDILEADEGEHHQHGEADIIGAAMQREREQHRYATEQEMQLNNPRATVIPRRAACGVADRHRDAEHMGNRIVAAEDGHQTPKTERSSLQHRPDPVARLPLARLLERQYGGATLVFAHLESTHGADADDQD